MSLSFSYTIVFQFYCTLEFYIQVMDDADNGSERFSISGSNAGGGRCSDSCSEGGHGVSGVGVSSGVSGGTVGNGSNGGGASCDNGGGGVSGGGVSGVSGGGGGVSDVNGGGGICGGIIGRGGVSGGGGGGIDASNFD